MNRKTLLDDTEGDEDDDGGKNDETQVRWWQWKFAKFVMLDIK